MSTPVRSTDASAAGRRGDATRPTIAWINQSDGRLSDDDAGRIVEALNIQAPTIAAAWDVPVPLHVAARHGHVPAHADVKAYFLTHVEGARGLGFHAVDPDGDPYVRVFVDLCLEHAGTLSGPGSVAVCASHEAADYTADPECERYIPASRSGDEIAIEIADPVEAFCYDVTVRDGSKVSVTDFVLPSYYDPSAKPPYDQMGLVSSPLQVLRGGYLIVRDAAGHVTNLLGDDYPDWRKTSKTEASRPFRRANAKPI